MTNCRPPCRQGTTILDPSPPDLRTRWSDARSLHHLDGSGVRIDHEQTVSSCLGEELEDRCALTGQRASARPRPTRPSCQPSGRVLAGRLLERHCRPRRLHRRRRHLTTREESGRGPADRTLARALHPAPGDATHGHRTGSPTRSALAGAIGARSHLLGGAWPSGEQWWLEAAGSEKAGGGRQMQIDEAATAPGRSGPSARAGELPPRGNAGGPRTAGGGGRQGDAPRTLRRGCLWSGWPCTGSSRVSGQRSCTNAGRTLPGSPTPCARHEERPRQTRESC